MTLTLIIGLVVLMVLGFPIAFALAIASAIAVFVGGAIRSWSSSRKCLRASTAFR